MSSLMIGTTSSLLDKLWGVSTSVNLIVVPDVKLKSWLGKAASGKEDDSQHNIYIDILQHTAL